MGFKVVDSIRVWWPAIAMVPSEDRPGEFDSQPFKVLLEPPTEAEMRKIDEDWLARTPVERMKDQHYYTRRLVKGWEGVEDAGGGEIPFNPETFAQALQFPWFSQAVMAAYRELMAGPKGRLGN